MQLDRYKDLFVSEAREHLKVLTSLIPSSASSQPDSETINELFRHAHSLKGMAATMQLASISTLAHATEDLLGKVRAGEFPVNKPLIELLLNASDTIAQMVDLVDGGGAPPEHTELITKLRSYAPGTEKAEPVAETTDGAATTLIQPQPQQQELSNTVRIRTALLDRLLNLTGELLTVKHRIESCAIESGSPKFREPIRDLSMLLKHLQREIFQARMLPFATIADRFPRMVRDLARTQEKEINFIITGDSIELDRGILELIAEPLMHLLRNAVDHGLENPSERLSAGKPAACTLSLDIVRASDHIQLEVTDDGRGMNLPLIIKKAMSQGLIEEHRINAMTREELLMLVCTPGFTTAAGVTEISGRGVGMDVVSHAIHTIGGSLAIASEQGKGTKISLNLPISVSIIQALLIACGSLTMAIPICNIQKTIEISTNSIYEKSGTPHFNLDEQPVPLRNLAAIFRQQPLKNSSGFLPVIITEVNGFPTGLIADRLIGQQELFVRPLQLPLSRLRGLAGATRTGDGQIIFVLDVAACAHPGLSA